MRWVWMFALLTAVAAVEARADTTDVAPPTTTPSGTVDSAAVADTIVFVPSPEKLTSARVTNPVDFEQRLSQNPTTALFKSMLVPGLGQIGNRRYVKAGVFIALEVWFVGAIVHYGRQASDYRDQYDALPADSSFRDLRDEYYRLYDDRRDERNKYTWFAAITVFVSMFDAFVDAHLSGSPESHHDDTFDIDVRPDGQGGANLALTFRF